MLKYIRIICATLLLLIILTNVGEEALAKNTGFSTITLPKEDIDLFLDSINISVLKKEPQKKAIKCFDVNESGQIAIGCGDSNYKTVCIYTSSGVFQYGYSFKCSGTFGIEMDDNHLTIYFVRSDVALSISPKGEIESIAKIQNTLENNSYWNNVVFSTRRKAKNSEYIIKNNIGFLGLFSSAYSELVVTNIKGETNTIYDVSSSQLLKMSLAFTVIVAFITVAVLVVAWQFKKLKDEC